MTKDFNRIIFKNKLDELVFKKDIGNFNNFLLNDANSHHLQSFLLLCSGVIKKNSIIKKLEDIVGDYHFYKKGNYTYAQIVNLDSEWYLFYKENIWPCGKRKVNETRRGVKKKYIDDIMSIKNLGELNFYQAISVFNNIKFKVFVSGNLD